MAAFNPLRITNTSVGLRKGDSTDDPALPYQVQNDLFVFLQDHYLSQGPANNPPGFTLPRDIRKAVNGSTTTTMLGTLPAELAANPGITFAAMSGGINDVHTLVSPSVYGPNVTNMMTDLNGAGISQGWWVGPYAWGEDGGFRSGIVTFDATVSPIVQAAGLNYISLIPLFDAIKAQYNPGNLVVGPATTPDAAGTHFNPWGSAQVCQYVIAYLINNRILTFA